MIFSKCSFPNVHLGGPDEEAEELSDEERPTKVDDEADMSDHTDSHLRRFVIFAFSLLTVSLNQAK